MTPICFACVGDRRAGKGWQGSTGVQAQPPSGKVLITLGKAGVAAEGPDTFNGPTESDPDKNNNAGLEGGAADAKGNVYVRTEPIDRRGFRQMLPAAPIEIFVSLFTGTWLRYMPLKDLCGNCRH